MRIGCVRHLRDRGPLHPASLSPPASKPTPFTPGGSAPLAVRDLLGYLRRHTFTVFMWYRLAVAALMLILIATGARSATIHPAA